MLGYLLRRVLSSAVTIILVTIIIFVIIRMIGDPTYLMLPPDATRADRDLLRQTMGLNRPILVQYATFLRDIAVGDFGLSYRFSQPAMDVVLDRMGYTAILTVTALVLAAAIGVPLGVLSAVYRDGWVDMLGRTFAVVGQSAPPFFFGLLFVAFFSVKLRLLPTSGAGGPLHLVMPAAALGWYSAAGIMRLSRSSMSEVLETEYVKMAKIKGVPRRSVIFKHALSNACLPVITFAALQLGVLLGGAVSIEAVFAWPGLGQLILKSIDDLDYTVVQAAVTLIAVGFAVINLLVDVVYAWIDPRIRYD